MTYSIEGIIVNNQNQSPIKGAKITIIPGDSTFTNTEGSFIINGDIPESGSLFMTISALGYQAIEPSLYKGDNTLKPNLGVLQLQPIITSLAEYKIKSSQLNKDQIK
jgi:hypothetical protein